MTLEKNRPAAALAVLLGALALSEAVAQQTMTYAYDAAGRLTSASYDDTLTTTFTYDPNGNVLSIVTAPPAAAVPEAPGAAGLPATFAFGEVSPNPLRDRSVLRYQLPQTAPVRLEIYEAGGRRVRTVVNGVLPAGYYAAPWDGSDDHGRQVASGLYFARFRAGAFQRSAAIAVLR